MIGEEIRNIKSGRRELRQFGLTVGIVLILFGAFLWWRGRDIYPFLIGIGAALVILGLTVPSILLPLQKPWMALAVVLGWVMTRVILTLLFFLVFTPLGLLARLFGRDAMKRELDGEATSYWIRMDSQAVDNREFENQF